MAGGRFDWVGDALPREVAIAWLDRLWAEVERSPQAKRLVVPLPESGAGRANVKVVRSRRGHFIGKRLLRGRCHHEWQGYRAFAAHGLPLPELLAFSERRRFGLHVASLLVTRFAEAQNLSWEQRDAPDPARLIGAARVLARIHAAGLCHGDPRARNFLATAPEPLVFDLPSWRKLSAAAQRRDLVRFLGSAWLLLGAAAPFESLLAEWSARSVALPDSAAELLEAAKRWSAGEARP